MASIDVDALIEQQSVWRSASLVLIWAALAMAVDGYDLLSVSYAAPHIIEQWGVSRASFGIAFSVGGIGQLAGGILFGLLADWLGRKPAIVLGTLLLGLSTLATVLASNLDQLIWLRLLAGFGVGGVAPVAIVLVNEYAPQRLRATLVAVMYIGYTLGSASAGLVAAYGAEAFGWQFIFWVGGLAPIAIALALLFVLPESIRFLAVRRPRSPDLLRLARRLAPDRAIAADTVFVVHEPRTARIPFRLLFVNGRYIATLLFWLAYFANSLTLFTLVSWQPTLLGSLGLDKAHAAVTASLYGVVGSLGSLLITRLIDKRGIGAMVLPPLIGLPALIGLGYLGGAPLAVIMLVSWISGFAVSGGQTGLHATGAILYPTAIRANGVSFGLFSARIAGVVAPYIAGVLFTDAGAVRLILWLAALPLLVVALCYAGLDRVQARRTVPLPVLP